jgi:hypothetical protein
MRAYFDGGLVEELFRITALMTRAAGLTNLYSPQCLEVAFSEVRGCRRYPSR